MSGGPRPRAALALLLVVLVPLHALLLQRGFLLQHDVFASDLLHGAFPLRAYLGRTVAAGSFPLWNPMVFSGVPFLSDITAGTLFPPNLVLFPLLDPFTALNILIVLTFLFGALGAWLLAREYGAGGIAASLAGAAFALSGFNVSHVKHLSMHETAAFLPWVAWALERTLRRHGRRAPVLLAVLLALQLSAGMPQIVYYTLLLVALRLAAEPLFPSAPGASRSRLRRAATAAAAVALGLGAAGLPIVTAAMHAAITFRGRPTWEFASRFPYRLADLPTFLYPDAAGAFRDMSYYHGGIPWETYGYFGLLPVALALAAPLLLRRSPAVRFWSLVLVLSMLVVAGPGLPLYRMLWEWLPGMSLFRFPTRFLLLVGLAGAILAALAADEIARRLTRGGRRAGLATLLGIFAIATVDLVLWQRTRLPVDDLAAWRRPSPWRAAIERDGDGGRIYVLDGRSLWERATVESRGFQEGFDRYRAAGLAPYGNLALLAGLPSASGYVDLVPDRTQLFWGWYNTWWVDPLFQPPQYDPAAGGLTPEFSALLDAAAVRHLVSPHPLGNPSLTLLRDGPLRLYRNESSLPRAYLATDWRPVVGVREAAAWLFDPSHRGIPAVEGGPPSPGAGAIDALEVRQESPQRLAVRVTGKAEGLLVLTDTLAPGWRATVDGTAAELVTVNGYQTGVFLTAGPHDVVLRYRPPGFGAGCALSLLSLAALGAWVFAAGFGSVPDETR